MRVIYSQITVTQLACAGGNGSSNRRDCWNIDDICNRLACVLPHIFHPLSAKEFCTDRRFETKLAYGRIRNFVGDFSVFPKLRCTQQNLLSDSHVCRPLRWGTQQISLKTHQSSCQRLYLSRQRKLTWRDRLILVVCWLRTFNLSTSERHRRINKRIYKVRLSKQEFMNIDRPKHLVSNLSKMLRWTVCDVYSVSKAAAFWHIQSSWNG